MAVAVIARKSTRDEAKVSVTRQEEWGREWAAQHRPGLEVLVFSDNAASGTRMDRPGWLAFQDAVRAGRVTDVWAWEQSRLTRAGDVAWDEVCSLLTAAGIREVHTHRQGAVSVVEGDRLHGRFNSLMDQHEREVARVRTLEGLEAIARQGRPSGATGYGYRRVYDASGRPQLERDPDQAAVVRRMVMQVIHGYSLGRIADDLNERGVPTANGGTEWRRDAVRRIITAPRIAGLRVHRDEVVGTAAWAPIVDRITWERAQARLASNKPGRTRDQRRQYLLTGGLAVCAECGTALISATSIAAGRRRVPSYQCPHKSRGGCGKCSILADRLEDEVAAIVGEYLDDPVVVDVLNERHTTEAPPLDELASVEAKLVALAEQYARGDLLEMEHAAARRVLVDRHRALSASVAALAGQPDPITAEVLGGAWRGGQTDLRRAVLLELVDRVEVSRAHRDGRRVSTADRVVVRFR